MPVVPLLVIVFGLAVLIGLCFEATWITTMRDVQVRGVTALAFILQGLAHTYLGKNTRQARVVSSILAILVIGTMHGLLIAQALAAAGVLHGVTVDTYQREFSQMPALGTILSFMLLSAALLLYQHCGSLRLVQLLHSLVLALASLSLLGHLFNSPKMFWLKQDFSPPMAPHTAAALLVLAYWGWSRVAELRRVKARVTGSTLL